MCEFGTVIFATLIVNYFCIAMQTGKFVSESVEEQTEQVFQIYVLIECVTSSSRYFLSSSVRFRSEKCDYIINRKRTDAGKYLIRILSF